MKKFAKIMAITALVLAVLGFMLTIIGGLGGGAKLTRIMAEKGRLSFGPEDFEWLGNLSIVVDGDGTVVFDDKHEILTIGSCEFSASADEVESFVFNMPGGDVDIVQGSTDEWEVFIEGFGQIQTYVENGTLYVTGGQNAFVTEFGDVAISVPDGETLQKIEINLGAGDMDIFGLNGEEVEISVGAGDITIESVYAKKIEVSVGAGEVEIADGDMKDVEVSVGMGLADITGNISGNLDGSVAMGQLLVEVKDSTEKEHNYNISCVAGEVRIGGRSYAGVGNSMEIDNEADTTYNLDCSMGNIQISFQ